MMPARVTVAGLCLLAASAFGEGAVPAGDRNRGSSSTPVFPPMTDAKMDRSPAAIALAVADLGSDDFSTREAAGMRLWWIGEPARAALRTATMSADPEVRTRASAVMSLLDAAAALKPCNVRTPLMACCRAPREAECLPVSLPLAKPALILVARPQDVAAADGNSRGMRLLVANTGNTKLVFPSCDGTLHLLQEARDRAGVWRSIEYPKGSSCGVSFLFHPELPAERCWWFVVPKYEGAFATKLRFRLEYFADGKKTPPYAVLYSNEFEGSINETQFKLN